MANPLKRRHTDNDNLDIANTWPRFLVIQADNDSPVTSLSPFAIAKAIQGIAGPPIMVKKQRNETLLVEIDRKCYSDNLLKAKLFAGLVVTITPHKSLNTKKGVIRCSDLAGCSEEEIQSELASQGVTEVRRIKVRREGELKSTNTLILTFNKSALPTDIKVGFLNVKVDLYIPNPLRCFQCQGFGHGKDKCSKEKICAKCGTAGHEEDGCERSYFCINCKGDHPAYSKKCSKWQEEKDIVHRKHTCNISFPEARRQVQSERATTLSYAAVTKKSTNMTTEIGTQTDITWPDADKAYSFIETHTVRKVMSSTQTEGTKEHSPLSETLHKDHKPEDHIRTPSEGKKQEQQHLKENKPAKKQNKYKNDSNLEKMEVDLLPPKPPDHIPEKSRSPIRHPSKKK